MKKLILVVALSLAAAVCATAQDLSILSKAARMAYDWLASEGYKPSIDEDNDVATGIGEAAPLDDQESPAYNLNGQRVNREYRGIVIRKGRKTLNN